MNDAAVESLILDLLDWIAARDRTYEEVIAIWRTSCPKLPVWEDANNRGLVIRQVANGECLVRITSSGMALLDQNKLSQT